MAIEPKDSGRAISIHALREEGDRLRGFFRSPAWDFYPRPPRGGRRRPLRLHPPHTHISIHALREEGDGCEDSFGLLRGISIHALREEGDGAARAAERSRQYFYPRPPRGGRRQRRQDGNRLRRISIHALREEGDANCPACRLRCFYFYPRPPRGGRRIIYADPPWSYQFLSTPSARRATRHHHRRPDRSGISIHALREEGDVRHRRYSPLIPHFYPRPPRGGRLQFFHRIRLGAKFLSTPSARRATGMTTLTSRDSNISIHALREEGDVRHRRYSPLIPHFYPRPPRGGRLTGGVFIFALSLFLSTPSARRATCSQRSCSAVD